MVQELNQKEIKDENVKLCPKCGGSGRSRKWSGEETKTITCPRCGGTGELYTEEI